MGPMWAALLSRPILGLEAVRAAWAFRVRGGVIPSGDVLGWRVATAYGHADHAVDAKDLIRFLEWRRAIRRLVP